MFANFWLYMLFLVYGNIYFVIVRSLLYLYTTHAIFPVNTKSNLFNIVLQRKCLFFSLNKQRIGSANKFENLAKVKNISFYVYILSKQLQHVYLFRKLHLLYGIYTEMKILSRLVSNLNERMVTTSISLFVCGICFCYFLKYTLPPN